MPAQTHSTPDRIDSMMAIPNTIQLVPAAAHTIDFERLLKVLYSYIGTIATPSAANGVSYSVSLGLSAIDRFWSEVGNGIYLLKTKSGLAWRALQNAGNMVDAAISDHQNLDFKFVRELFLTLSPVNTKISPGIRMMFLELLKRRSVVLLGTQHPITIICTELSKDDNEREVSERGLACCVDALYANNGLHDSTGAAVSAECGIVRLHRRDGDLELAAAEAVTLYRRTKRKLSQHAAVSEVGERRVSGFRQQARKAATELAHVRMDQKGQHYNEAIEAILFAITGENMTDQVFTTWPPMPSLVLNQIEDRHTIHCAEDLGQVCYELGFTERAIRWLERAEELAMHLVGSAILETVTAHITEKIRSLRSADVLEMS